MNPPDLENLKYVTRRKFFLLFCTGMGALALGSLLNEKLFAAPAPDAAPETGPEDAPAPPP